MVPYEVTVFTGDEPGAGTDSNIILKAFGVGGATSDIKLEKAGERFERGHADLMKVRVSMWTDYMCLIY